jgi:hypothetical protein
VIPAQQRDEKSLGTEAEPNIPTPSLNAADAAKEVGPLHPVPFPRRAIPGDEAAIPPAAHDPVDDDPARFPAQAGHHIARTGAPTGQRDDGNPVAIPDRR